MLASEEGALIPRGLHGTGTALGEDQEDLQGINSVLVNGHGSDECRCSHFQLLVHR